MTGTEQSGRSRRRRSALADETPWTVPAVAPAAPQQPPVSATQAPPRRRARNVVEARGRKLARDAAYGWAAAQARAAERRRELLDELAAARNRGTATDTLHGYLTEACHRYDIDPNTLPPEFLAKIGAAH
jgi:hypothetical protein